MPGLIPENILEEILSRINIVELISSYLPLKRAGRNFRTTCPFHHEKTPSFMVSPERQIYHCFGCGESGNAFKFLMRYEKLDFPEAVEYLAKKTGIVLPEKSPEANKTTNFNAQLYKVNEIAALFYHQLLNSFDHKDAKQYLLKRDIDESTIKQFKIGVAADKWDALINHCRSKNISLSLLEKAGLIINRDNGSGYYDRFRKRIIFPISDARGRIMGFGGRVFSGTDELNAKYVNSPESQIYTKGKNLYGLNYAKDAIRDNDTAVIVEGYLDFIIPYQAGFHHLVASLGTALTQDQINLLKRYTQNIIMVYDADEAGQLATLRTLDIFIEEGMNVKIASLPEGLDPDSFIRKNNIEEFKKIISLAENLFDYKLKRCKLRFNIKEIEGKASISSEMLPTINKFKNALVKSEYIKKLAEELNVKEDVLLQELKKIKDNKPLFTREEKISLKRNYSINPTERLLVKLMLEERELVARIKDCLEPNDFQDERLAKVVSIMFDLTMQGKDIDQKRLVNYFDDDETLQFICASSFDQGIPEENREKIVSDCIKLIKNKKITLSRQLLQKEIELAERNNDQEKLNKLRIEFCNLFKKRQVI